MPSAWGTSWGSAWGSAWGSIASPTLAYLESADLVRRAKIRLARPTTDAAFTSSVADDVWYDCASEAQSRVNLDLATYIPDVTHTVPTALTSEDGGYTYGFGDDTDSEAIFALGQFSVYAARSDIPDYPLEHGIDFTVEGTVIRLPNNTSRTFADGGPWAQYVAPSNVITAETQPTVPKFARIALLAEMCRLAAGRVRDTSINWEQEYQDRWQQVLASARTQAFGKSAGSRPRPMRRFGRRYP